MAINAPETCPPPAHTSSHELARYSKVQFQALERMRPKLDTRAGIADEYGRPTIIEGTLDDLMAKQLIGRAHPKPLWPWSSKPVAENLGVVDHWWSMHLRRFDLEPTFRFLNQNLGWAKPKLQDPHAADT